MHSAFTEVANLNIMKSLPHLILLLRAMLSLVSQAWQPTEGLLSCMTRFLPCITCPDLHLQS